MTDLHKNVLQLKGRINNWILGVKGLINISNDELEKIEINKLFSFSLPYLYNINQISVKKKEIYQFRDNQLI